MSIRLAYVVTHPTTANIFLRGQLRFLREQGDFDITVISAPGLELDAVREREGVRTIGVPMSRAVRLADGPAALAGVFRAIRKVRPHVLNASTPKAALLGLLAARTLDVPLRIYLLRGLRLQGARGGARSALGLAEHASVACAHHVVCVSESLRSTFVEMGFAHRDKTSVLPSNGIDLSRFRPRSAIPEEARAVRERHGIRAGVPVVGFVGRLVTDKGVADMVTAIERASRSCPDLHFLVVGGNLAGDELPTDLMRRLRALPRLTLTGQVSEPAPYYAAMDTLLFPSYREGLPNVPLEAAACAVPTVGYRVTGVVDAVEDGVTGTLVARDAAVPLGDALARYLLDPVLRRAHGLAARARVIERFTNERTWKGWLALYENKLRERGISR